MNLKSNTTQAQFRRLESILSGILPTGVLTASGEIVKNSENILADDKVAIVYDELDTEINIYQFYKDDSYVIAYKSSNDSLNAIEIEKWLATLKQHLTRVNDNGEGKVESFSPKIKNGPDYSPLNNFKAELPWAKRVEIAREESQLACKKLAEMTDMQVLEHIFRLEIQLKEFSRISAEKYAKIRKALLDESDRKHYAKIIDQKDKKDKAAAKKLKGGLAVKPEENHKLNKLQLEMKREGLDYDDSDSVKEFTQVFKSVLVKKGILNQDGSIRA